MKGAATTDPKVLHRILMRALEHEDHLRKIKASPDDLEAARRATGEAMSAYDEAGFDPLEASVPHNRTYAVRMHGGLLRHSVAQEWHEAVKEWRYGRNAGRSTTTLICDLCGCMRVQYWFELTNKKTGRTIRIGSECIQNWHSPGIVTAINFDRKGLEKAHRRELRLNELEKAAETDEWLRARLPKLRQTIEKYGKVFDEAEDRVRAALRKPALGGQS
ncbi:hypothetical protein GCM10017784_35180 [Deinococcus indicus]|uniref:hypothetical protein n=1 Tax=Deinococcus indicus TaxID=223556 RepID=UPI00174E2E2C|nr:hypothetical protein [Deinococcus indicus]GHG37701.1 hypothetical protein GCM10017784_35180 [Deinococcus indicus]